MEVGSVLKYGVLLGYAKKRREVDYAPWWIIFEWMHQVLKMNQGRKQSIEVFRDLPEYTAKTFHFFKKSS